MKQLAAAATAFGLVFPRGAEALSGNHDHHVNARRPHRADVELRAGDGTRLFHRDWGSGEAVLFLHGWGLDSSFWEYQMEHVANAGYRAIAFDRRSHGRSGDPGRGYDYDTLADDVATVIERLDLRDLTIVAHSLGGGEAVRYLAKHGERRVTRVMLVGATLPLLLRTPDNPQGVDRAVFDAWRAVLARDRATWLRENAPGFWMPDTSPSLMAWGDAIPWRCTVRAMRALTHTMTEADLRPDLRSLRIPTRFVHGTADRSVPVPFARAAAALVRGSELREYEGAPHGLPLTHLTRFNAELLEFLRS